jgi:hypothetical protein
MREGGIGEVGPVGERRAFKLVVSAKAARRKSAEPEKVAPLKSAPLKRAASLKSASPEKAAPLNGARRKKVASAKVAPPKNVAFEKEPDLPKKYLSKNAYCSNSTFEKLVAAWLAGRLSFFATFLLQFVIPKLRFAVKRRQQIPGIVLGFDFRRRLFPSAAVPVVCITHRKPALNRKSPLITPRLTVASCNAMPGAGALNLPPPSPRRRRCTRSKTKSQRRDRLSGLCQAERGRQRFCEMAQRRHISGHARSPLSTRSCHFQD